MLEVYRAEWMNVKQGAADPAFSKGMDQGPSLGPSCCIFL